MSISDEALIHHAVDARATAHAPYSNFRIGTALLLRDGAVVTGVNVENSSFGLTVCAERHAVAAAVRLGAQDVLIFDPKNADALDFLAAAQRALQAETTPSDAADVSPTPCHHPIH